MREIDRIPDRLRTPQPVGGGHRNRPWSKENRDEFGELLEHRREKEVESPDEQTDPESEDREERKQEQESERGRIVDELA